MKEGWTSLHKTIREINLVVKGLRCIECKQGGYVSVQFCSDCATVKVHRMQTRWVCISAILF